MAWHTINLGPNARDDFGHECYRWTHVMPGDVVQSKGTIAYKIDDFYFRDDPQVKFYRLHKSPVLVLARINGIPGEVGAPEGRVTFVCLSRHGIIIVVNDLNFGR